MIIGTVAPESMQTFQLESLPSFICYRYNKLHKLVVFLNDERIKSGWRKVVDVNPTNLVYYNTSEIKGYKKFYSVKIGHGHVQAKCVLVVENKGRRPMQIHGFTSSRGTVNVIPDGL